MAAGLTFLLIVSVVLLKALADTPEEEAARQATENPIQRRIRLAQRAEEAARAARQATADLAGEAGEGEDVKDGLNQVHTWGWLFEDAYAGLHAEGPEFVAATTEVFRKAAGRLGYVHVKSTSFQEAVRTYLARSVGFKELPDYTQTASSSGKAVFIQAVGALRLHVLHDLISHQLTATNKGLETNHSYLAKGLIALGAATGCLALWTLAVWLVQCCKGRKLQAQADQEVDNEQQANRTGRHVSRVLDEMVYNRAVVPRGLAPPPLYAGMAGTARAGRASH